MIRNKDLQPMNSLDQVNEKPWRKNLNNVFHQLEQMNRHYTETNVMQCNQFEEFTARHKSDEWIEGYHRRLVKNEMKIEEADALGPLAQQKIAQMEAELKQKRENTSRILASNSLQTEENQDFWENVTDSPSGKA